MKIKEILSQYRRDFTATLVCEHCANESPLLCGYDDAHFHANVIPAMVCPSCDRTAPSDYRPLTTKHPEGRTV